MFDITNKQKLMRNKHK